MTEKSKQNPVFSSHVQTSGSKSENLVIDKGRRRLLQGALAAPLMNSRVFAQTGKTFDTIIVGAGVFGAWTAWHLSRAGQSVALVDSWGPGNARSSSGGESRVIRTAYGPDAIYSRMAQESLLWWRALSSRQSQPIFHPTGVLWLSSYRDNYIETSIKNLKQLGVRHEVLNEEELANRYPQIDMQDIKIGFLEQDGGALLARRGVQAVVAEAIAAGCKLIIDKAEAPLQNGDSIFVRLAGAQTLTAANAVYACGPWLPKVFPEIIGPRIRPTRQLVFFFGTPAGDHRFAPPQLPVWADFNGGDIFYGIPDLESRGFKIAHDVHGPEFDPDTRQPHGSHLEAEQKVRTYLQKRFPDLAAAPLLGVRICQYENSSNGDYLLDRHPIFKGVWLVGGGSGHGYKNGPAVGAQVAAGVMGRSDYQAEPRFTLASKLTIHNRAVH